MISLDSSTLARFWRKIENTDPAKCWNWLAGVSKYGYGKLRVKVDGQWKIMASHRLSYMIHRGDIPEGVNVLHSCDNPPCVNPEHLFLGTQLDNVKDMHEKGRDNNQRKGPRRTLLLHGVENYLRKLTEADVVEIRTRKGLGQTAASMASDYLVSKSTIERVLNGKCWSKVA
jgi:hypothetical protein